MSKVSVYEIQTPLRAQYKSSPEAAWVTDHARTAGADPRDPFHATVEPMAGCGGSSYGKGSFAEQQRATNSRKGARLTQKFSTH